ncbi:TetR family transcriptional regulator [Dongia mobilis]|uniref:HTH-type transcriptional regulator BetI n=1 Tax=Dongia mobilis TaxID=578943 RepID=A0A4R6WGZ7_9PROT|nr:transcriptional regulator BetI [Dongia mobilis]TDQ77581.1 TetR family transcriptional regulator [Dongia mobilis]
MPRLSIEQLRRQELAAAAYEILQEEGIAGTTLAKVAERAGMSKGIVVHYFGGKDALLEAVMRRANSMLRDEVISRMNQASTPRGRLDAIIAGNFSPDFFKPEICNAWLSLCAEVPRNREFARIQRAIHARMRSNLLSALRHLLAPERREAAVIGITAMIDGLWLRFGLNQDGLDLAEARRQMDSILALHLGPRDAIPTGDYT